MIAPRQAVNRAGLTRRGATEGHHASRGDAFSWRHGLRHRPRMDRPAGRSFAAVHAPEKDGSWLAPDAEFMPAGQITIEPVEHKTALRLMFGRLPDGNLQADAQEYLAD